MFEFEHYGESLDSTPDFLFLKKHYEESLDLLEEQSNLFIFVDPSDIQENIALDLNKIKENERTKCKQRFL
jgi:hypothetical protein